MPPANVDAERALLGALMANNKAYQYVESFLLPEHFCDPIHGTIFRAISKACEQDRLADCVTLRNHFLNTGELDALGGDAYLASLLEAMVGIINAGDYGRRIFECWQRRQIIAVCEDTINDAFKGSTDVTELGGIASTRLDEVAILGQSETDPALLYDAMGGAIQAGIAARARGGMAGIATGIGPFDRRHLGLEDNCLYILGGRPGAGKTGFAAKVATNVAERGTPVLVITLESSKEAFARRVISERSGVPLLKIRTGNWSVEEDKRIGDAYIWAQGVPLYIEDHAGLNVRVITAKAKRFMRKHKATRILVVIDHMHIIPEDDADLKRGQVVATSGVVKGLHALCKTLSSPVLALAQLNRKVEDREDKRPQMSDLYYSSIIEAMADVIMFLYRPAYYESDQPPDQKVGELDERYADRRRQWADRQEAVKNRLELINAKVREGQTGTDILFADLERSYFSEWMQ